MNRFKTTRFVLTVLLAGTAVTAFLPAQAQPMINESVMHHDEGRMRERMAKHWEKRQSELKTKLHLSDAQEPAWMAFVQEMKVSPTRLARPIDLENLAKLSTPERMEKMNAVHEANFATMRAHIKQRTEATRTFYNQLSVEQQKVFDTETLPAHSPWKGKAD
jgi:protein CpxP